MFNGWKIPVIRAISGVCAVVIDRPEQKRAVPYKKVSNSAMVEADVGLGNETRTKHQQSITSRAPNRETSNRKLAKFQARRTLPQSLFDNLKHGSSRGTQLSVILEK